METRRSTNDGPGAEWHAGYDAAIRDAIALIDGLSGPGLGNLSSPVLLRLRTRLVQLEQKQQAA